MSRKLFIVARSRVDVFQSLNSVLRNESDVEIIFDRRKALAPVRPWGQERRNRWDVDERIRTNGYAVMHPGDEGGSGGNIRWS